MVCYLKTFYSVVWSSIAWNMGVLGGTRSWRLNFRHELCFFDRVEGNLDGLWSLSLRSFFLPFGLHRGKVQGGDTVRKRHSPGEILGAVDRLEGLQRNQAARKAFVVGCFEELAFDAWGRDLQCVLGRSRNQFFDV